MSEIRELADLLSKIEIKGVEDRSLLMNVVKFDEERWKLVLGGVAIAFMHDYFLPAVFADLEKQIGPVARTLIVKYARSVGLNDGKAVCRSLSKEKLSIEEAIRIAKNIFTIWCLLGWGKIEKMEIIGNKFVAERSSSYEGEGYLRLGRGPAKTPRCWIALGYVIGVIEGLLGVKVVEGKEVKCIGMGDETCRFEIEWET